MEITFGDSRIRSFRRSDAASITSCANNRNVSIFLRDTFPFPYRESDAKAWIRFAATQQPESNFAIAEKNIAIGGIGMQFFGDVFRRNAELGYWIGEPYWGRGIATAVVRNFVPYAFETFEIERLTAGIFEGNEASARVLEKNGFKLEGVQRQHVIKDDTVRNYKIYGLLRSDLLQS